MLLLPRLMECSDHTENLSCVCACMCVYLCVCVCVSMGMYMQSLFACVLESQKHKQREKSVYACVCNETYIETETVYV